MHVIAFYASSRTYLNKQKTKKSINHTLKCNV